MTFLLSDRFYSILLLGFTLIGFATAQKGLPKAALGYSEISLCSIKT